MVGENFNQAKTFAPQHHVFAESSQSSEIAAMRLPPIGEAAVAFAFFMGKGRIDLAIAAVGHLGGLDDATRLTASVEHDPALARGRGVRLVLGGAGRGLDAL